MSSQIPNRIRYKIFTIMDECSAALPIIYQMTSYRQFDAMLDFLLTNKLTGVNFLDWFKTCHNSSVLKMAQFIIMKLEKEKNVRPIFAHKDYIINGR